MATIPMTLLPDPSDETALQAWVEASADGMPLRLLVDTGSARTAVPRIEPFAGRERRARPAGRGLFGATLDDELVHVDCLQTGAVVSRDLLVDLQPESWPYPPLIGMDVFRSHACCFRFPDQTIALDDPPPPTAAWQPLVSEPKQAPAVELRWGPTTVKAVWDTGAGITIVDHSWATAHPDVITITTSVGRGTDATGHTVTHPQGRLASPMIGDLAFPEQDCGVIDLSALNAALASPIHIIVGLPLMAQTTWYLDFPQQRWTLHR